jgi:hypothetical protein
METSASARGTSVVFSEKQMSVVVASSGRSQQSSTLTQIPGDLSFTSLENPWFLWLSQVLSSSSCGEASSYAWSERRPESFCIPRSYLLKNVDTMR